MYIQVVREFAMRVTHDLEFKITIHLNVSHSKMLQDRAILTTAH